MNMVRGKIIKSHKFLYADWHNERQQAEYKITCH